MTKNSWILTMGMGALCTLFAPGASAGCGKGIASRLQVMMPRTEKQAYRMMPSAAQTEQDAAAAGRGVTGLWLTSVSVGGQVLFQAFESFTGDGLEFLNDNGSPLEGNVCFGTWTEAPKDTVKVYHPSWNYDMTGNLIGTVIIKEQITLDPGGNSFKGTVVVDSYDLNGQISGPEFRADLSGKRITTD